jgi:hypothetical protein
MSTQSDEQFSEVVNFLFEGRSNMQDVVQHFSLPKKVTVMSTFMLLAAWRVSFFVGLMAISVELQIQWNQIRNVKSLDSVSQLVPFIVALGQFTHIAYSTIRGKDYVNYADCIRDAVEPRVWKKVNDKGRGLVGVLVLSDMLILGYLVTPCPKRGGRQLDEEQHEMIVAAEDV